MVDLQDALRRDTLDPAELERAGRRLAKTVDDGLKVRVLGQCTTTWLASMITALGWGRGMKLVVGSGEYDNVIQELTVLERADVVVLVPWNQRVLAPGSMTPAERISAELATWQHAWRLAAERGARIVQVGYDCDGVGPLGHHLSGAAGDVAAIRALDAELRRALPPDAYFVDLDRVAGRLGRATFYDPRQYHWTKQPFSMAGAAALARHVVAGIRATTTGPKKVLVLDLDNTLWGGVVGETGPLGITLGETPDGEAFRALQLYAKGLARRGVLLAVASKNNPEDAREPFGKHPDMVLAMEDFAAFEASWDPKAVALRRIAQTLNLGLDSFVFLDDNPAEREHVRQALPEVEVVEVADEPADYVRALEAGLWFETVALTNEDRARTAQYATERERVELSKTSASIEDYLTSLAMTAEIRAIDDTDMQRVVQLIGKTNQWNLTTRRHSEAQVRALLADGVGWTLRLADRFGDYGLVAVVLAIPAGDDLVIDTWLMSCRVIGRTVEHLLAGELIRTAERRGYRRLAGEYVPTKKNAVVASLYDDLGFTRLPGDGMRYALELPAAIPRTFVARR